MIPKLLKYVTHFLAFHPMYMSGVLGRCVVCQCHMAPDLLPVVPITRNFLVRARPSAPCNPRNPSRTSPCSPDIHMHASEYEVLLPLEVLIVPASMSMSTSITPSLPFFLSPSSQEASVEQVQAQRAEIEAKKDKRPPPRGMGFMGDAWQKLMWWELTPREFAFALAPWSLVEGPMRVKVNAIIILVLKLTQVTKHPPSLPPNHPSTHPPIHLSSHPLIHPCTHPLIHLSTNLPPYRYVLRPL